MVSCPVGLLLYGWSLEKRYHWIVPTLATVLCSFSISSSTTPIMGYLVDIFGDRSGCAVNRCALVRILNLAIFSLSDSDGQKEFLYSDSRRE